MTVPATIQNLGNISASGSIVVDLFASTDPMLDASDKALATHIPVVINIKPGKAQNVQLRFSASSIPAGKYFLIADLNSTQSLAESNFANNNVISAASVSIT